MEETAFILVMCYCCIDYPLQGTLELTCWERTFLERHKQQPSGNM